MTYFNLRKRDPEAEPEPEEDIEEPEEENENEEQPQQKAHGPIITGLLGPGRWIAARFGTGTAWGAHIVAAWAIGHYGGWISAAVVTVWLGAVLAFVPRESLEQAAAWVERRTPGHTAARAAQATTEDSLVDPLVTVLWKLIAGAPGVHVKTLAEHLRAAAPEATVDRASVRAKLGALGIPVRGSVRDAAGKVNEGVHRDDLQAWEEALPAASPAAPSEPRSGPVATAVTCDVADAPTPVATPLSRLRGLLSREVG